MTQEDATKHAEEFYWNLFCFTRRSTSKKFGPTCESGCRSWRTAEFIARGRIICRADSEEVFIRGNNRVFAAITRMLIHRDNYFGS